MSAILRVGCRVGGSSSNATKAVARASAIINSSRPEGCLHALHEGSEDERNEKRDVIISGRARSRLGSGGVGDGGTVQAARGDPIY